MLAQSAAHLGCASVVLERGRDIPAASVSMLTIVGDGNDPRALAQLARQVDTVTLENEFVDADSLIALEQSGVPLWPASSTVRVIQDKLRRREALSAANLPVPRFAAAPDKASVATLGASLACLKATLHFPVDWFLLRDAARTLMKATVLIRREGLKQRMPQKPLRFLSDMNKLAMAMSANARRSDAKKKRKRTLRQMKALEKKIAGQAKAHRNLLAAHWAEAELSEQQAQLIIARIDNILTQLPPRSRRRTNASSGSARWPTRTRSSASTKRTWRCSSGARPEPTSSLAINYGSARRRRA